MLLLERQIVRIHRCSDAAGARRVIVGFHARGTRHAAAALAEKQHGLRDDFRLVALLAVLTFPLAGLDAALDEYLGALAQVLGAELRLLAPRDDAEPLGLFLALALGVLVVAIDGNRELGYRLATGRVTHLRITAQIADDHALVERHSVLLALSDPWRPERLRSRTRR